MNLDIVEFYNYILILTNNQMVRLRVSQLNIREQTHNIDCVTKLEIRINNLKEKVISFKTRYVPCKFWEFVNFFVCKES